MSYRERESIVNIVSGILITAVFALMVYNRHQDYNLHPFSYWKCHCHQGDRYSGGG